MKYIKTIILVLGLVILSVLAFVGVANAQSFKSGDTITVPANETVNNMLFAGGNNIYIAGTVNGDVICGGQTVTISGTINGDVICGGQTIIISGKVNGDIRLGGQTVTISNTIDGSATVGAQTLVIDKNAKINRDLLGGSQNVTINGQVKRDIVARATNLTVNGKVWRNIKGGAENITIGSNGLVVGNIDYTSNNNPVIIKGGKILGKVTVTAPKTQNNNKAFSPVAFTFGFFVYAFIAAMIIALVLVGLSPRVFNEATEATIKKPGMTFLVGLVSAIVIPALIFFLFMSFIGIPLALLLMLAWLLVMAVSGPFAAYLLGKLLLPKSKQPVGIMALGAALLLILYFIPIIGFIAMIAAYIFGMGIVLNRAKWLTISTPKVVHKKKA